MLTIKDHNFVLQSYLPPKTLMCSPEWVKMGVEQYYNSPSIRKFLVYIEDELLPTDLTTTPSATKKTTKTKNESKDDLTILVNDKLPALSKAQQEKAAKMPTPESLARSLGFANFNSMKKSMEDQSFPESSRYYLFVGCSILADMLTRAGLSSKLDARFTKFIMSAYLGVTEKTEQYTTSDNKVHITWGADPTRRLVEERQPMPLPLIDITPGTEDPDNPRDQFEIDLDKLERALPASMQLQQYKDQEQLSQILG